MIITKELINDIQGACDVDEILGSLACKKCGCEVRVDWFEQTLTCTGCDDL